MPNIFERLGLQPDATAEEVATYLSQALWLQETGLEDELSALLTALCAREREAGKREAWVQVSELFSPANERMLMLRQYPLTYIYKADGDDEWYICRETYGNGWSYLNNELKWVYATSEEDTSVNLPSLPAAAERWKWYEEAEAREKGGVK